MGSIKTRKLRDRHGFRGQFRRKIKAKIRRLRQEKERLKLLKQAPWQPQKYEKFDIGEIFGKSFDQVLIDDAVESLFYGGENPPKESLEELEAEVEAENARIRAIFGATRVVLHWGGHPHKRRQPDGQAQNTGRRERRGAIPAQGDEAGKGSRD